MTPETIKAITIAIEAILPELNANSPSERAHQEAIAAMQETVDRLNCSLETARRNAAEDVLYLAKNGQTEIEFGNGQRVFFTLLGYGNPEYQMSPADEFTWMAAVARKVLEPPEPPYVRDYSSTF